MAKLPPLNQLRAFEAAGRHLSFTRAADELALTPTAISHQMRLLEDALGVKLFRRLPRNLMLTDAGRMLLAEAKETFARLAFTVEQLATDTLHYSLMLSTTQTFASSWLVPRLHRFQKDNPGIDVRLGASQRAVDFHREGVDAAIRCGRGGWPGLRAVKLFDEVQTPLISRALLAKGPPIEQPRDLLWYPLLYESPFDAEDWHVWFSGAGVANPALRAGNAFDSSLMVMQAALSGAGVALVMPALCRENLASGQLVQPFDCRVASGRAYYLVCPEVSANDVKIVAFRDWLLKELEDDPLRQESTAPDRVPSTAARVRPALPPRRRSRDDVRAR